MRCRFARARQMSLELADAKGASENHNEIYAGRDREDFQ
jgi:hypothetical protein